MEELAARTIRAVQLFVEALTLLCLVVSRLILLLLQLVGAMGERAGVRVFAYAVQLPEFTNLRLKFNLEALLPSAANSFLSRCKANLSKIVGRGRCYRLCFRLLLAVLLRCSSASRSLLLLWVCSYTSK